MLTIVVPLDGSAFAEHAVPFALGLARRRPARLELVMAHEPARGVHGVHGAPVPDLALDQARDAELRARQRRYLDGTRERLASGDGSPDVGVVLLDGPAAETLAAHAQETQADVVVLTTHGRGGVSRLWLGSVTDELVRRLTIPVVAIRPPKRRSPTDAAPRHTGSPIRRVLVAVDGTPRGEAVTNQLRRLLGDAGVEYVHLRVVAPLHPIAHAVASDAEYVRDLEEQERIAAEYLADLRRRLAAQGLSTSTRTARDVQPARAILTCASALDVDLVALATHGRGPAHRLLLGSDADKVLRSASRPVLLYHVPEGAGGGDERATAAASGASPAGR